MDKFEFSYEHAHPNAKALMKEEFFWSPIDETAPFGSDDGFDAAYGFREWRASAPAQNPLDYLKDLFDRWAYPPFDLHEMDTVKIRAYIDAGAEMDEATLQQRMSEMKAMLKTMGDSAMLKTTDEQLKQIILASQQSMGGTYLLGFDNAIIATGFAQLVLEGKIDGDLKSLAITALQRQMLPVVLNGYRDEYQETRKSQLAKLLQVINKT